jgi:hypothetical protein
VTDAIARGRTALSLALSWMSLGYGIFVATVEPVWADDELKIVLGAEIIVLAVVSFVWSGRRMHLGLALIAAGASAPFIMLATAPLYWDEVLAFHGEAFWTSVAIGAVIALPLMALGAFVLRRASGSDHRKDPWWLVTVEWAILLGIWLVALAFRGDDWDSGVALVALGGALALVGVLVATVRRFRVTRRGVGLLLLFLGTAGAAVLAVSKLFVGGHMSAAEAMPAIVAAGAVAVVGALMALKRRGDPPGVST